LENRLQRAEALLRTFIPNIDLADPNFDTIIQQRRLAGQTGIAGDSVKSDVSRPSTSDYGQDDEDHDAQLRSMIETTGQLEIDDQGNWDFHGGSSAAVFLRRMREQFNGLLGGEGRTPVLPRPLRSTQVPMRDSPSTSIESPFDSGLPNTMDLPPKDIARKLCSNALDCACALLRFVHGPSFYEMFERIYNTPAENFGDEENRFLPLLYVTLALGCMFMNEHDESQTSEPATYMEGIDQG
jgi:hypothetical protein